VNQRVSHTKTVPIIGVASIWTIHTEAECTGLKNSKRGTNNNTNTPQAMTTSIEEKPATPVAVKVAEAMKSIVRFAADDTYRWLGLLGSTDKHWILLLYHLFSVTTILPQYIVHVIFLMLCVTLSVCIETWIHIVGSGTDTGNRIHEALLGSKLLKRGKKTRYKYNRRIYFNMAIPSLCMFTYNGRKAHVSKYGYRSSNPTISHYVMPSI
jgi:hypothetical protein